MTLDQLRIFLVVADEQHITRAAKHLNMTQSAVSAAISALEARHGVVLFDRVGRRIVLNGSGAAFVAEARRVLAEAQRAEAMLADLSGAPSGRVDLSASQTVASYWLPSLLVRYTESFPRVELRLSASNTAKVVEDVRGGRADIGIVEGDGRFDGLRTESVARDRLVLIVGPSHPWADGREVRLEDLGTTTWIMREVGSGTRAAFEAELATLGADPSALKVKMEMPSNEACLAAVRAGRSATVLSRRTALSELEGGRLHEARFRLSPRVFTVLRRADTYTPLAIRELMTLLRGAEGAAPVA